MKTQQIIILILVTVVATGAGFFGGMQYQKTQRTTLGEFGRGQFNQLNSGQRAGQLMRRNGQNGQGIFGEITSTDDKSITVKLPDGSSKIVILSEKTSVNKQATGTKYDIKEGERVAVFGATNSDGSVTAQSIQLNPMARGIGSISPTPKK